MIVENEITFRHINDRDTPASWWIKLINTLLTVILICLIFVYHLVDLTLYAVNNAVEDWRVGLTNTRIFVIVIEVIVCAIHPIPQSYPTDSRIFAEESFYSATKDTHSISYVANDVALGLPSRYHICALTSRDIFLLK